jgi:hypothetical protein
MTQPQGRESFDDEVDLEAPEADVVEQHTSTRDEDEPARGGDLPLEANDADAAEQGLDVPGDDEDEYR